MKRLTDELIDSLREFLIDVTWHCGIEEGDVENGIAGIGQAFTDLRRYKAALEEVARRPCQHGAVLSAPCSHAESPVSMCPPCIARRALADGEEEK